MIIETKYNLGDYLFPITRGMTEIAVVCGFCAGRGTITGADGLSRPCPDCYGSRTKTISSLEQWVVGDMYRVRRIEANRASDDMNAETSDHWPDRYMRIIYMAGGSGTMWEESRLFPSKEQAQAECDRLNALDATNEHETVTL